jgi:hypothetical protein
MENIQNSSTFKRRLPKILNLIRVYIVKILTGFKLETSKIPKKQKDE